MMTINEETYDVVVVGSGGGGLVGAYVAASRGLRTLVIEKPDLVGGTTSYSGAGLWFPGSAPISRAGVEDRVEDARTYLRSVVDDSSREPLQDAYLQAGAQLIDELEKNEWFQSFVYGPVPEYYPSVPGASAAGHTIFPPQVTVAELGEHARLVRTCLPTERWGHDEGPVLNGGRALIGRALKAYLETGNGSFRLYGPKVRVNTISAGPFLTDISKAWSEESRQSTRSAIGRPGHPEEIISTALYLASDASSYTTGALIRVDGGLY